MNELKVFENPEFGEIRTVAVGDKTLFVGNDVAKALGYVETAKAIRTHCKGVSEMDIPTNGGTYVKHFVGLSDNVTYVIEDLNLGDNAVSNYRYTLNFNPQMWIPANVETID